ALGAYHAWYDVTHPPKAPNMLATVVGGDIDYRVPPDYAQVTRNAISGSVTVGLAGIGIEGTMTGATHDIGVGCFSWSTARFYSLTGERLIHNSVGVGAGAGTVAANIGPQIIIAAAIEIIIEALQAVIEAKEAGPKLQANLLSAQQPY